MTTRRLWEPKKKPSQPFPTPDTWVNATPDTSIRGQWMVSRDFVCLPKEQMITYTTNITLRSIIERLESSLGLQAWIAATAMAILLLLRIRPRMDALKPIEDALSPFTNMVASILHMPVEQGAFNAQWIGTFIFYCVPLIIIAVCSYLAATKWSPTHIGLSPDFLHLLVRLEFPNDQSLVPNKLTGFCVYHKVSWSDITRVFVLKPGNKFSVRTGAIAIKTRNGKQLEIKFDHLSNMEEWSKLASALRAFLPQDVVENEVMEILEQSTKPKSFTELWLQELVAPPNRKKLQPLGNGQALKDGTYTIVSQLGMGGQATVYLGASNDSKRETVAIKEFVLPLTSETIAREKAAREFYQLASLLAKLDHPGIAKLYDAFVEDHRAYLVLERAQGKSLRQMVNEFGACGDLQAIELGVQLCDILSYLHDEPLKLVHQDFNPDNFILDSSGKVKLIDLSFTDSATADGATAVVGKQAYMPPEQIQGNPAGASDIYALGATLQFVLTGRDPVPITESHPADENDQVSPQLDAIVARATALSVDERYRSADELKSALLELKGARLDIRQKEKEYLT